MSTDATQLLHHGGRLRAAAAQFRIPLTDWIDLSTGINPNGWPVPAIPTECWQRLPEDEDALERVACTYYGSAHTLATAGSQAALQILPLLRARCRVGIIHLSYQEHLHAWRSAGHDVRTLSSENIARELADVDVLLLVHPNNPTGARYSTEQLLSWHQTLAARDGWLILDEAFMDATPQHSLAAQSHHAGLIVLRSLGKFFGLAGARVGFVCAEKDFLDRLRARLGPWTIASPSRWIASQALSDVAWQNTTRKRLLAEGARLQKVLHDYAMPPDGGCALFQWQRNDRAMQLHHFLAQRGILTRLFNQPHSIRFGLPGDDSAWERLQHALQAWRAYE